MCADHADISESMADHRSEGTCRVAWTGDVDSATRMLSRYDGCELHRSV